VSVRYGPGGELVPLDPIFEDINHMRRMVRRMLFDAGAELREELPIIEAGLTHKGRPICISVTGPPITIQISADIRVHPRQALTLETWAAAGYITEQAAQLLQAIARSEYGFVIVGEPESGKTSLLSSLIRYIPNPESLKSVERAGELRLPDGAERFVVKWPLGEADGVPFGECVVNALLKAPGCIVLDEVRADEVQSIGPLLSAQDAPRQIWVFRGSADSKRIRSALSMVARRSDPAQPEAMVQALYRRLPFIVVLKKRKGRLELQEIAEWQFNTDDEYPDYVELMSTSWEGAELSGKRPSHTLTLPDDFWT
jgi:hypothetical protein